MAVYTAFRPRRPRTKAPFSVTSSRPQATSGSGIRRPTVRRPSVGTTAAPAAAAKPAVTQTPAYTPVATAAVPKITAPPPPSLATTADRNAASYNFTTGLADINTGARNLAMNYGGAPKVQQVGATWQADPNLPGGGKWVDSTSEIDITPNAPGSTLEVLARNLGITHQNIDNTQNNLGTFFSSNRLNDLGSADAAYEGDVGQAKRDYDAAISALFGGSGYAGLLGSRNQSLTAADVADQQAAAGTTPENQQGDPTAQTFQELAADPNIDWNAIHAAFDPAPPAYPNAWVPAWRRKR